MKKLILLTLLSVVGGLVQGAPYLPEQMRLRVTVRPSADLGLTGNSMFNARFFDGKIYVNQINVPCFGRYAMGSEIPEMLVNNSFDNTLEHRMVAPFRGADRTKYLLGSSSAAAAGALLTRYDYDGTNPVSVEAPDTMTVDAFDWIDDDTIIYAIYTSDNRKKLCLADVVADPFAVTKNTTWNANGFVETSVTTRIRNVRKGDVYSGYVYYGDGNQNDNPSFYALNLATGVETRLGNLGTLTGGGSYGLWTVVERGGYLYVQTTDNGIQIYSLVDATTLGPLFASYSKEQLDALTGGSVQYFGLDVTPDGSKLLVCGLEGKVYQLEPPSAPLQGDQLQLRVTVNPSADLGIAGNSMFNPRFFDGKIYANQINVPCFGRYPMGSTTPEILVNNSSDNTLEHRMVAPFRGDLTEFFIIGSSSAAAPTTSFVRYDAYGYSPIPTETPGSLTADAFDWVDDDTLIYAVYTSGNRKRLYLVDVAAEPFTLTPNPAWNAEGFVETSVGTRIRNVRKGDLFANFAYYGDGNQNSSPAFYALNLTTGVETLLGNLGTLTGGGSYGLWTVVERDGYLYVQTTDNGIFVYKMTDATTLGPLYATYSKAQLDAVTGGSTQYFGLDVTTDGRRLLLGGLEGKVYELEGRPAVNISVSDTTLTLSWPTWAGPMVVQSSSDLSASFADMDPQPEVVITGEFQTVTLPVVPGTKQGYFRLRK